jgi:hypothetical protein
VWRSLAALHVEGCSKRFVSTTKPNSITAAYYPRNGTTAAAEQTGTCRLISFAAQAKPETTCTHHIFSVFPVFLTGRGLGLFRHLRWAVECEHDDVGVPLWAAAGEVKLPSTAVAAGYAHRRGRDRPASRRSRRGRARSSMTPVIPVTSHLP